MNKMLCNNNLDKVGKWGESRFLFRVVIVMVFMSVVNIPSYAHALDTIHTNQTIELKLGLNSTSSTKSSSQNIDFSRFFSSSNISQGDITGFLKEAAITGIKLSILIISMTMQVIKGLLSVFK